MLFSTVDVASLLLLLLLVMPRLGMSSAVVADRRLGRREAASQAPPLLCHRKTAEDIIRGAVRELARLPEDVSLGRK